MGSIENLDYSKRTDLSKSSFQRYRWSSHLYINTECCWLMKYGFFPISFNWKITTTVTDGTSWYTAKFLARKGPSSLCNINPYRTQSLHERIQRGGGQGVQTPPEKSQKYRFSEQYWSRTLEKSQRYQASIQFWAIISMLAKRHLNGVSLAGRWWPAYTGICLDPLSPLKKNVVKVGPRLTKLSGSTHAWIWI